MDGRPNAIKKGAGKIGNMAARSKRKIEEKNGKVILIAVVEFNRSWILEKSYRKSNELYFRVADCRPAINKTKKLYLSYRLEWIKCVRRGVAGYVGAGGMAWEATAGTGGVGGLLRWALLMVRRKASRL